MSEGNCLVVLQFRCLSDNLTSMKMYIWRIKAWMEWLDNDLKKENTFAFWMAQV